MPPAQAHGGAQNRHVSSSPSKTMIMKMMTMRRISEASARNRADPRARLERLNTIETTNGREIQHTDTDATNTVWDVKIFTE